MHSQCRTLTTSVIWETRMITDKKITADDTRLINNYYNCTEIILYMCVTTYTPSPTKSTSIRHAVLNQLQIRKQFCGCNRPPYNCTCFQAVIR